MTESSPRKDRPESPPDGQATYPSAVVYRKVAVKAGGEGAATVIVTTQRGQVWVSIVPPFTWEAIMEPGKVDELIQTLGLARDDAKRMAAGRRPP
jgi:hypothetical protein